MEDKQMTINDIIDYVMHTPGNTNPAVLRGMLNSLIEESVDESVDESAGESAGESNGL